MDLGFIRSRRSLTKSKSINRPKNSVGLACTVVVPMYKLIGRSVSLYVHTNILDIQTNTNIYANLRLYGPEFQSLFACCVITPGLFDHPNIPGYCQHCNIYVSISLYVQEVCTYVQTY